MTPASRKQVVAHSKEHHELSERRACQLAGVSRTGVRYKAKPDNDNALRRRLKELATKYTSYGYLFLHSLLRTEGLVMNKKRSYRIYTSEGLQVRTKNRKKLKKARTPMVEPSKPNMRWSMDFVSDQLANRLRFRALNVIDDCSREMVGQLTATSISGKQVSRFLDQLVQLRSKPIKAVCDNGTEFTSKTMFFWQESDGVKLGFIQPGKPTQNAFVESLNGKFRNECVYTNTIEHAEQEITKWREYYNNVRPHSSLKYMAPAAFAKKAA